jgi:hypothetical protein
VIKNLIYHCCPLRTNDLWRANLDQLLARWHIFDGVRAIAVSYDDGSKLWPFEEVYRYIRSIIGEAELGTKYVRLQNDRNLREVATFRPLLDIVENTRREMTFYAHTKGNATYDDVEGAIYWRNTMYHLLLDHWQERQQELCQGYAACGTHKMIWPSDCRPPYPSALRYGHWMFAGTFFWFRNDRVFTHSKWTIVPRDRYGAEAWLSGMFEPHEVKSCFQPWPEEKYPPPSPYDPNLYRTLGMAIADCELKHPSYNI